MTTFFLNLLTIGTIISGIFSITSKNPIISVIFLISTFVQAAGYLILIGVQFIGISYIIVYVGAIAVLFLFVIMMINIKLTDILESGSQYTKNLPLAIIIGFIFLFIVYTIIPFNFYNDLIVYVFINKLIVLNTEYNIISLTNSYIPNTLDFLIYHSNNGFNILANSDILFTPFLQIQTLGHNLYADDAILLIILSFILLLAMFAIIIISSKNY